MGRHRSGWVQPSDLSRRPLTACWLDREDQVVDLVGVCVADVVDLVTDVYARGLHALLHEECVVVPVDTFVIEGAHGDEIIDNWGGSIRVTRSTAAD